MLLAPVVLSLLALADPPGSAPSPAPAVAAARERLARRPLWPGFDPAAAPLAVFDGARTWLFGHPSPPAGFEPLFGAAGVLVRQGRHAEVTANSSETIGGVVTATLLLPDSGSADIEELAAVAVHELFHVFERAHHPAWSANEVSLLSDGGADAGLLALRRLESEALRRALAASGRESARWTAAALALRRERYARLPADLAAYERAVERWEGLAQYVQRAALSRRTGSIRTDEYPPEEIRRRGYDTGEALALLLDRVAGDWKERLGEETPLDLLLSAALGSTTAPAFSPAERADAEARARADMALLEEDKVRLLREQAESPGHTLVVVAFGEPLFPQAFDPLNLRRLSAKEVFHGRFLKAGNDAGAIEVMGRSALTEAWGKDPLFGGIRRVRIAGLEKEPMVSTIDGAIEVVAEGVTARFAKASVAYAGNVLEVKVGEAR